MIELKLGHRSAKIERNQWTGNHEPWVKLCDQFHWKDLFGYWPDKDYATAKLAQSIIGGEVVGIATVYPAEQVSGKLDLPTERARVMRLVVRSGTGGGEWDEDLHPRDEAGKFASSDSSGSAPAFSTKTWSAKSMEDRRTEWNKLSQSERDKLADPRHSIRNAQEAILAGVPDHPPFSGDPKADLQRRIADLSDRIAVQARSPMKEQLNDLDDSLARAGVTPEKRYALTQAAADAVAAQEFESEARQLGDHGAYHLRYDAQTATDILNVLPGAHDAMDEAVVRTAAVFHDAGYLTEPSRAFLDEGHQRWSESHYNENLRDTVAQALGDEAADRIGHVIGTHDSTDIDWQEEPATSAMRTADNLAVFHGDKLPPVFRDVSGNTDLLEQLGRKEISLDDARTAMHANVDTSQHSDAVKGQFHKAVNEVGAFTPKFTLGMLGGRIEGVEWKDDHLRVNLARNKSVDLANRILDLGQKQFAKFAKSFGQDPDVFTKNLSFTFRAPSGKPVISAVVRGMVMRFVLRDFVEEQHPRDEGGKFTSGGGGGKQTKEQKIAHVSAMIDKLLAGGFTYQPELDIEPTTGFMVSPYSDREFVKTAADTTKDDILAYVEKNNDLLTQSDHYLGGWLNKDNGNVYLDVSIRAETPEEGKRVGCEHQQIAMFDLEHFQEIRLEC